MSSLQSEGEVWADLIRDFGKMILVGSAPKDTPLDCIQWIFSILEKIKHGLERTKGERDQITAYYEVSDYPITDEGFVFIYNAIAGRSGSKNDAQAVEEFFRSLNFTVWTNNCDKNKENLMKSIEAASACFEAGNFYCCFVFMMAHGSIGTIVCADGKRLQLEDAFMAFWTKKRGVPKLVFVQACRTKEPDAESDACLVPEKADFIVYYATDIGDKAWREKDGSWFIQSIISAFENMYTRHHVADMMTYVCEKLNQKCTSDEDQQLTNLAGQLSKHLNLRCVDSKNSSVKEY